MMARVRRLLLVARPYDISEAPFDAFVVRRLRIIQMLQEHYDVRVVLLRTPTDQAEPHDALRPSVLDELSLLEPDRSRRARLARLWGDRGPPAHAPALGRVLTEFRPSAAVTFGPWLDEEFQPVFSKLPTMHFFEEDLGRMREIASQSARGKLLRAAEVRARGRSKHQPAVVVAISLREIRAARRRYPRATVMWHPFLLDRQEFPLAQDPSRGDAVLVVGNFDQPRNSEGLRDVLEALRHRRDAPAIELLSAAYPSCGLHSYVEIGALRFEGRVDDIYSRYRSARLTLVPARRVTGMKTTVLQGWAAGCPVVCFPASADSVGPFAYRAAAVARYPARVADALIGLSIDASKRADLARAGFAAYVQYFDQRRRGAELMHALRQIQRPG